MEGYSMHVCAHVHTHTYTLSIFRGSEFNDTDKCWTSKLTPYDVLV